MELQDKITELEKTIAKLRLIVEGAISTITITSERKDPYTAGHQKRVADLSRAIAQEMGLPENVVDGIRMAGLIHDLGKIGVPGEILGKPSKLNEIEFQLVKVHPETGYELLKDVIFPWPVAEIVFQHHERINGSGYPRKLKGPDIIVEAKIIAVADVVEAISSARAYRQPLGLDAALEQISKNRGILYDEKASDACLKLFKEKRFEFK